MSDQHELNALRAQARGAFQQGDYRASAHLLRRLAEQIRAPEPRPLPAAVQPLDEKRDASDPPKQIFLQDLYAEVASVLAAQPQLDTAALPLVSVLMSTHNVADYVEGAVTSILRQSYPHLELVVVDDASDDRTWEILQRMQTCERRLRCHRLNIRLGTYFARNTALTLAKGAFIFFQDADDLSHPERIRLCMQALLEPGVTAVRCAHSRILYPEGVVLPVNGSLGRVGYVTLGVGRAVFDTLGYFNCTTRGSDSEFISRLERSCAADGTEIRKIGLSLYYSALREGSLTQDMIANDPAADGHIVHSVPAVRQAYVAAYEALHAQTPIADFPRIFSFPRLRDVVPVDPGMSRLTNPVQRVVVSLCSIPAREESLRAVLHAMTPQADEIHLYLDGYAEVPAFIDRLYPSVRVRTSREFPGLRDNGKFIALTTLDSPCYYLTVDDDIAYPPDYVHSLIERIEHYRRRVVVGVHGVLLPESPAGYFSGFRRVHSFWNALERDALMSNLGTGTMAFHSELLAGLDYRQFAHAGMVDLLVAAFCRRRQIPMVAIARPLYWLRDIGGASGSLYQEFKDSDEAQAAWVRAHAPWGYRAIQEAVDALHNAEVRETLTPLLPALPQSLW
jgi:glycosyltransferase involved in cell wall biosynthesis